jgi:hypothetical protein
MLEVAVLSHHSRLNAKLANLETLKENIYKSSKDLIGANLQGLGQV